MSYPDAASFRQALEQRLKNQAADTGLGLARLRKRVAFGFDVWPALAAQDQHTASHNRTLKLLKASL